MEMCSKIRAALYEADNVVPLCYVKPHFMIPCLSLISIIQISSAQRTLSLSEAFHSDISQQISKENIHSLAACLPCTCVSSSSKLNLHVRISGGDYLQRVTV